MKTRPKYYPSDTLSAHRTDQDRSPRLTRVWIPPSASVASRRPPKRSRGSFRGSLVNPRANREIVFESTLERDLAYILLTTPSVARVRDQVGPVEYVDADGVIREHTFDFIAELKNSTRIAFAVKPAARVESSGVRKTLDLIRDQLSGVAEQFEVRTGDHITRDRAADARLMHRALRTRSDADIATVLAFAATLRGSMVIRALLATTRNDGHGFMAVACLIADGVLEHVGPGRISRNSLVRLRRTTATTH